VQNRAKMAASVALSRLEYLLASSGVSRNYDRLR
jgi:hypothetical protein